MDQATLIAKFYELSLEKVGFSQAREDLLIFKKWNWSYDKALEFQCDSLKFIQQNPHKKILILCNHPTCFTMGRGLQKKAGKVIQGLTPTEDFSGLPFPVHKINRGGGLTYHYPGQLIIYPIMKLGGKNPSLSELADLVFDSLIQVIQEKTDLKLSKKKGDLIGLWTVGERTKKIASFGIGIERFITQHGVALNIEDGEIFKVLAKMHPCGLEGSIYDFLNSLIQTPTPTSVETLSTAFEEHLLSKI